MKMNEDRQKAIEANERIFKLEAELKVLQEKYDLLEEMKQDIKNNEI
jgi:hypothetical protein